MLFEYQLPLRSRVAELCKSSGKNSFQKLLTSDRLPGKKVIIVTDFPVISHRRFLGLGCVLMMLQPPSTLPTQELPSTSRIKEDRSSVGDTFEGH